MPPSIVLWNKAENRPEGVAPADVDAALASGKYDRHQTTVTTEVNGVPLTRNVEGPAGARAIGPNERIMDVEAARAAAEASRSRRADALSDPWFTFIEAAADTATLGLVHERGEAADIRRGSDTKAAFLGGAVGMFAPLPLGVANAGRRAGVAAAETLLKSAERSMAGRVLGEAASGAAVMGAVSLGQQASDAAITDHKFSAEAVASHVGLGALVGGAFGAAAGVLSKLPVGSRAKVSTQGGLLDPKSTESLAARNAVNDALGTLDDAVLDYSRRAGAVRVLQREHPDFVPAGLPDRVDAAIKAADASGRKLREFDLDAVLSGDDLKLRDRFQKALDEHQRRVLAVESSFEATAAERAGRNFHERGKLHVEEGRAPFDPERAGFRSGEVRSMEEIVGAQGAGADMHAVILDSLMTPERRAMYERTYGRAWEDLPQETPVGRNAAVGEESLGGRVTPTSEAGTNAAGARAKRVARTESAPYESVEIGRATERGMPAGRAPAPRSTPGLEGRVDDALAGAEELEAARAAAEFAGTPRGRARAYIDAKAAERRALGVEPDPIRSAATGAIQIPEVGARARVGKYLDAKRAERINVLGEPRPTQVGTFPAREPGVPSGTADMAAVGAPDPGMPVPRDPKALYPDIGRPIPLKGPTGEASRALVEDLWRVRSLEPPRANPLDRAAAKMQALGDSIREASGGKLDAAAAVDLLKSEGRAAPSNALGAQVDQIIAARRIARAAADESRGAATELREAGRRRVLSWLGGQVAKNTVRRAVGGAMGWSAGGPIGGFLGAAFANKLFGTTGRVASAAGGLGATVDNAARAALIAKAGTATVGGLRPVTATYGGEHVKDPVLRAQKIRELARNPEAVREMVAGAMGDDALLNPKLSANLGELTHRQLVNLSLRAPMFVLDALGRARAVEEREVRRFEEYERATFDLPGLLRKYADGTISGVEAEALREQFPEVRSRLIAGALADQEALRKLPGDRLDAIERALGIPLTASADPAFVARQQINFGPPPGPTGGTGPTPPPPTPAQAGPRAPGN